MQTELRIRAQTAQSFPRNHSAVMEQIVARPKKNFPWRGMLAVLAFGSVIAIFLYTLATSREYYTAPLSERPHLVEHASLRPAGNIGHGFGIVGSCMLISLFAYSARKRFAFMKNWGNVRTWLGVHIFFGVSGPLFITLHTAFKFNGIVAVSYWSMIAVMLSGFIGRYLYAQIPRDLCGMELTLQEAQAAHQQLVEALRKRYELTLKEIAQIEDYLLGNLREAQGLVLLRVFFHDVSRWWRLYRVRSFLRAHVNISHDELLEMIRLVRQQALLQREIVLFQALHRAFHYWHVIHKPFAYVMLTIMFIHIAVAVAFGYWWIFE